MQGYQLLMYSLPSLATPLAQDLPVRPSSDLFTPLCLASKVELNLYVTNDQIFKGMFFNLCYEGRGKGHNEPFI